MQVTCPNCGARYAVDPLAIGPVGRIVQCARCAHRWLQTVAAAKTAAAARDAVESAMNSPLTAPKPAAPVSTFAGDAPGRSPDPAPAAPSLGAAIAFDAAPDLVIRPPRQRTSLPVVIAPRRKLRLPTAGQVAAAAAVVLVVALAAGLYFYGDQLIARIPPEWRTVLNLH